MDTPSSSWADTEPRARAGDEAFLSAWPDADGDLPAMADARRRTGTR